MTLKECQIRSKESIECFFNAEIDYSKKFTSYRITVDSKLKSFLSFGMINQNSFLKNSKTLWRNLI